MQNENKDKENRLERTHQKDCKTGWSSKISKNLFRALFGVIFFFSKVIIGAPNICFLEYSNIQTFSYCVMPLLQALSEDRQTEVSMKLNSKG